MDWFPVACRIAIVLGCTGLAALAVESIRYWILSRKKIR